MNNKHMQSLAVVFSLALCVFLFSTGAVVAGEDKELKKEEFKKGWEAKRTQMYDQLGLTEEQRVALKTHKETHRASLKTLR